MWQNSFKDELTKLAKTDHTSAGIKDFAGGLDPLGFVTSEYGLKAEREGATPLQHAGKAGLAMAGGAVGGGVLVPAVATIAAKRDFSPKGLASALTKVPRTLSAIRRINKDLKRYASTRGTGYGGSKPQTISDQTFDDFKTVFGDQMPGSGSEGHKLTKKMKSAYSDDPYIRARARKRIGALLGKADIHQRDHLRDQFSELTQGPVRAVQTGAAIGAAGAAAQYSKGILTQRELAKNGHQK